jgi:hypothetical protein
MDRSEEENAYELETLLRAKRGQLAPGMLRRFASECCRRVSHLCLDPIYLRLLEFAGRRASGPPPQDQLAALRSEANLLYDRLYPGYGSPSATALALTAVGEAAFTESALDAAIGASSTAAEALASSAAAAVDDAQYDDVHEATYQNERQAQLELLRQLDPQLGGP